MHRHTWSLIVSVILLAAGPTAFAQQAQLSLARMECGGGVSAPRDVARFSDTYAFEGTQRPLTVSCYLIRHNDDIMIWDAGYPVPEPGAAEERNVASLVDQLAEVGVDPEEVSLVGISHYHGDHTGQAGAFPGATLLIGQGDWEVLTSGGAPGMANPAPVEHWISGGGQVEAVSGDKDVFGDGSVVMLDMPGHTPGHHSLLVRLKDKGDVLLTGDLAHLVENYETNGVPSFNTDRADTLASFDRFKKIAENLDATVIIQHDPRHLDRLPAFPEAAE